MIPLQVMNHLGLQVSKYYGKRYAIDSHEVHLIGIVNDVVVQLDAYICK